MTSRPSLDSLQACRAVAAISVAAFHLSVMMGEPRYGGTSVFLSLTKHGYLGVDFFFVLSGFVIFFAHRADLGHPDRWGRYAWRRFARVFPIYWLYTAIFMLLVMAGVGTAAHVSTSPLDVLTTFTLLRFSDVTTPLPVAWSLFHEVAFYLLFSVAILNVRAGLAAFMLLIAACGLWFHNVYEGDLHALSVYTASCNLDLVLGVGACWLAGTRGRGLREAVVAAVVLAGASWLLSHGSRAASLTLGIGFAFALVLLVKLERAGLLRVPRWVVALGNATYSIYLLHEAFSGLLLKLARSSHLQATLGPQLTYLLVLVAAILLGCAAYRLVERPMIRFLVNAPSAASAWAWGRRARTH